MNIDNAIDAHVGWKLKLSSYLHKPDKSLDPAKVGADNGCELGQWIHGEGKKYANLPEFTKLTVDHAQFHRAAAEVINRANSGQAVGEEVALGAKSAFAMASTAVVSDLMYLKRKL